MAHDLNIEHIASKLSPDDVVSIGVDSIQVENKIIYNLSVVISIEGKKASLIWTKDIEDNIVDPLYRDIQELYLLSSLYKDLHEYIKHNKIDFSVKIHKSWFNRYKYEQRQTKLKIDKL